MLYATELITLKAGLRFGIVPSVPHFLGTVQSASFPRVFSQVSHSQEEKYFFFFQTCTSSVKTPSAATHLMNFYHAVQIFIAGHALPSTGISGTIGFYFTTIGLIP